METTSRPTKINKSKLPSKITTIHQPEFSEVKMNLMKVKNPNISRFWRKQLFHYWNNNKISNFSIWTLTFNLIMMFTSESMKIFQLITNAKPIKVKASSSCRKTKSQTDKMRTKKIKLRSRRLTTIHMSNNSTHTTLD